MTRGLNARVEDLITEFHSAKERAEERILHLERAHLREDKLLRSFEKIDQLQGELLGILRNQHECSKEIETTCKTSLVSLAKDVHDLSNSTVPMDMSRPSDMFNKVDQLVASVQ